MIWGVGVVAVALGEIEPSSASPLKAALAGLEESVVGVGMLVAMVVVVVSLDALEEVPAAV